MPTAPSSDSSIPTSAAHPLDNVIWSALTHRHQAALALGDGAARRYPAEFAPFGAMADASAAGFHALAGLLTPGEQVALVTAGDVTPTAEFEILLQKPIVQMVQSKPSGDQAADPRMAPLGPDDATDMRALAELTKPGPFSSRTQELGAFLGVRENGRLVAMAGERMHLDGYAEVSAVCTHPDVRGRGLARSLVRAVSARIAARGEIPFLHAFEDNDSAIALYASLGFDLRATLRLTVLRRQPAAG